MFDNKKPTAMLLGRYQPFHDGHLELFKKAHENVGQVCIMVRDTHNTDDKNPFDFRIVESFIIKKLTEAGYTMYKDYIVMCVPNITEIDYGRDVGYSINKIELTPEIEAISATNIRKSMKAND